MISDESPFQHLPAVLAPKQAMYFDGIRFAIEMIDTSYRRLVDGLEAIAGEKESAAGNVPLAMLDAWAVIDSANRLRVLLAQTPGLKQKTPPMHAVRRALAPSEALRNSIQHLPGDITSHADADTPTWGSLSGIESTRPREAGDSS